MIKKDDFIGQSFTTKKGENYTVIREGARVNGTKTYIILFKESQNEKQVQKGAVTNNSVADIVYDINDYKCLSVEFKEFLLNNKLEYCTVVKALRIKGVYEKDSIIIKYGKNYKIKSEE